MPRLAEYLQCPECHAGALNLGDDRYSCMACGKTFPVVRGVPRFVSRDHYADSFGMQWNIHRKAQLDSHTGLPLTRRRYELAAHWPENLAGEAILEAGSGAGRFTEKFLPPLARKYYPSICPRRSTPILRITATTPTF